MNIDGQISAPTTRTIKTNLSRLSPVLLGCSLGGLLVFWLIGSHVDSKGVLRELFSFLTNSVLLPDAGAATGVMAIVWRQASDRL